MGLPAAVPWERVAYNLYVEQVSNWLILISLHELKFFSWKEKWVGTLIVLINNFPLSK